MSQTMVPPGRPGVPARWTSSAKAGVGTATGNDSPLWFTVAHGILNELYYPTMDHANTRDVGFLVAADGGFFSEEKRHTSHVIEPLAQGVPAYRIVNTCEDGRYRLTKVVFTDPRRPTLLLGVQFEALQGTLADYRLYALVAPHLGNHGMGNDGWVGDFRGVPLLFAQRRDAALALACSAGWRARSCGYVGTSDGWQQVRRHGRLADCYPEVRHGNIALTGEVDLAACDGRFVVALGFGTTPTAAGHHARASLLASFDERQAEYVAGWQEFQNGCLPLAGPCRGNFDLYRVSTAVLRTHESKRFQGAVIASLSIPWGDHRGDDDLGGYHLVWPRDHCHAALAFLAAGQAEHARRSLFYLMCTQGQDGSWLQNMWVDGRGYWTANQSDQTASFLLLVDALRRERALGGLDPWAQVERAAERLVGQGPVTEQDRWEENSGYAPYTLATMIAGLLAAAELAEEKGRTEAARRWRSTADEWNASIERWLYVTDTPLSRQLGIEGYYVRIGPPDTACAEDLKRLTVTIRNRPEGDNTYVAADIVSPDALALVRYGLRRPDDPRIRNTVRAIDATLRIETRAGPTWRRYRYDGYGETQDGGPFMGAGVGRGWPVLTAERAHYELARGDRAETERLLEALVSQSQAGGLLPEQVWDAPDVPERGLHNGGPTGSAMPLVWAHAEYINLLRSLRDGRVFDCPPQAEARYCGGAGTG